MFLNFRILIAYSEAFRYTKRIEGHLKVFSDDNIIINLYLEGYIWQDLHYRETFTMEKEALRS